MINNVGDKKDTLLRLATLSGTPGFLVFEANCEKLPNARYAAMHDLEWRKGIKALYEPLQELPSDITTMEGRFPDRNGNYHHKDVFSLLIEYPSLLNTFFPHNFTYNYMFWHSVQ